MTDRNITSEIVSPTKIRWWIRFTFFFVSYSGWKKSCTTLDRWNPINNRINHLSTGAGFLPSTVSQILSASFHKSLRWSAAAEFRAVGKHAFARAQQRAMYGKPQRLQLHHRCLPRPGDGLDGGPGIWWPIWWLVITWKREVLLKNTAFFGCFLCMLHDCVGKQTHIYIYI